MMSSRPLGKVRSPAGVIVLFFVTLGISSLVWQFKTFKEMKAYSGAGVGGGIGLLIAIVFGIVAWFLLPSEVGNLNAAEGRPKPVTGATGFWVLLPLIGGIVWLVKTQGALNEFWRFHGAPA
jgi:Domain of unknown function (DUF4234)